MTENKINVEAAKTDAENNYTSENTQATIPETKEEVTIPIKFNKEIKNLTVDEAAKLAQKGMKYDIIYNDYETLKELSRKNGKSVSEYLDDLKADGYNRRMSELTEKCGGDKALAEHILELESGEEYDTVKGFDELQKSFPDIKSPEELPEEILEAAKLKGTQLLDEYLRYLLAENKHLKDLEQTRKFNERVSIGSQINRKGQMSPEASEFLKGLWK